MSQENTFFAGNVYNKYETKNPIAKLLMKGFLNSLDALLMDLDFERILEVGCGEGFLTAHIASSKQDAYIEASDVSPEIIKLASSLFPTIKFSVQSVYNLGYKDGAFDLVLACEILEHLSNPIRAILEIKRITNKFCIFSVPREPLWRLLNIFRGKYLRNFGNTPGHLQHWGKSAFVNLLGNHFEIVEVRTPLPWSILLCEK